MSLCVFQCAFARLKDLQIIRTNVLGLAQPRNEQILKVKAPLKRGNCVVLLVEPLL